MARRTESHEILSREETIEGSSDRAFGAVFTVVFLLLGCWPLIKGRDPWLWAWAISGAFLAISVFKPGLLQPLNWLWTRFGILLGMVVSPIVLGIIFYLVVTPTGFVVRLLGKDLLRMKPNAKAQSYWIDRKPPGPAPESMKNQF